MDKINIDDLANACGLPAEHVNVSRGDLDYLTNLLNDKLCAGEITEYTITLGLYELVIRLHRYPLFAGCSISRDELRLPNVRRCFDARLASTLNKLK